MSPALPGNEHQRLLAAAQAWQAEGRPSAVIEVVDARGSAPRPAGTRMLVSAQDTVGTIGGGHLEWQAIDLARRALAEDGARFTAWEQVFPLGPRLGQCCGGSVTLRALPLDAEALARWPADHPRFHLQLYGAGHVGQAVIRLLAGLPCRVQWIDEREHLLDALQAGLPAHIRCTAADAVEGEVDTAPAQSSYLVMTHRHDLDLRIAEAVLRRDDVRWFGLIGSRTKRARFEHRLLDRGLPAERVAGMRCPIGLPGIDGKEPEVIAVSVVAQLLAEHPPSPPRPA